MLKLQRTGSSYKPTGVIIWTSCPLHVSGSEERKPPVWSSPPLTSLSRCKSVLCTASNWISGPSGQLSTGGTEHLPSSSLDCNVDTRSKLLICCCCNASLSYLRKNEIYFTQVFQESGASMCCLLMCKPSPALPAHTCTYHTWSPDRAILQSRDLLGEGCNPKQRAIGGPRLHWRNWSLVIIQQGTK